MDTPDTRAPKQRLVDRLADVLSPSATDSRTLSTLQRNRDNNHFLAVILNSFSRQTEGHTLTKLEQKFVDSFRQMGLTDDDFSTLGRAFADAPEAVRTQLFPERFASLRSSTAYGVEELRADAPAICKAAMESKNLLVVNAEKATYPAVKASQNVAVSEAGELTVDGQPVRAEDLTFELDENVPPPRPDKSYLDACREMGGGVVCYALPYEGPYPAGTRAQNLGRFRFWARKFYCADDTGEMWSDEP